MLLLCTCTCFCSFHESSWCSGATSVSAVVSCMWINILIHVSDKSCKYDFYHVKDLCALGKKWLQPSMNVLKHLARI